MADRPHRGQPRFRPAGDAPQRGAWLPEKQHARGSLHHAAQGTARVGHPAAVRRGIRDVRLVRRAEQLRQHSGGARRRRGRWPGRPRDKAGRPIALAGGHSCHRQGHSQVPRRLLADHAQGDGTSAAWAGARARLVAEGRPKNEQDHRQRGGSHRGDRRVGCRCVPLLRRA